MSIPILQSAGAISTGLVSPMNVAHPSGIVAGDTLALHCLIRGSGETVNTPSGWSSPFGADNVDDGSGEHCYTFLKEAIGSESGNLSISASTGENGFGARMYRISGATTTPDVDGNNVGSSSDEFWHGALTTLTADSLVVALVGFRSLSYAAPAFGSTSGGTWVESIADASGTSMRLQIQTLDKATPGAISGGIATMGAPGTGFSCRVFALKPASSVTLDKTRPDSDIDTSGWTTTPLFSKINDSSDATVIQATAV